MSKLISNADTKSPMTLSRNEFVLRGWPITGDTQSFNERKSRKNMRNSRVAIIGMGGVGRSPLDDFGPLGDRQIHHRGSRHV